MYTHRTVCDVLEEMRSADKKRNYSYLAGLIEELQTLTNRMEASLSQQGDYFEFRDKAKKLEKDIERLNKKKDKLENKIKKLKT